MADISRFASRAINAASELHVKSALNPALWFCAVVSVPSLIAGALLPDHPWWLIVIAFIPIFVTAFGFMFLLLFDRDRLQSENYQIRKQSLELIEQKGDFGPVYASTVEAIANPDYSQASIDHKEEKQ